MNRIEYLLGCLAEECNEVAHRALKAQRFGLAEVEPGQSLTNAQRIAAEMHDVIGVIEMLEAAGQIDVSRDNDAIERKKTKVEAYMGYSRRCGTLQDGISGAAVGEAPGAVMARLIAQGIGIWKLDDCDYVAGHSRDEVVRWYETTILDHPVEEVEPARLDLLVDVADEGEPPKICTAAEAVYAAMANDKLPVIIGTDPHYA